MGFKLIEKCPKTKARTGVLQTAHGDIQTPVFMPVGTQASVKYVSQYELEQLEASIILGNTFHLYLRPGHDLIGEAGGLHQFMDWHNPILTDSGGYQVYSLSAIRKITEEGVNFKSPIDGSSHFFSPEFSIDIQRNLGADIIMAFDECTPYPCSYEYAKDSMHLTHRWLDRCLSHFQSQDPIHGYNQFLAPIVQGSTYRDLRVESAEYIGQKDSTINAIGGLSVGEPEEELYSMTGEVCDVLPLDRARYLMGVGTPVNLLECISLGVDMFDCVMPTRNARHGVLYTKEGTINIKNAKWKHDFDLIEPGLKNGVSNRYSKAYLRHLFNVKEALGFQIASIHNLSFYLWLMEEARKQISEGSFSEWKEKIVQSMRNRI
jgi:queuine tRNA-ribosyltransferase